MGQLVVVNFVSLDGVMQSVLSADEDRDGGFDQGGWVLPYVDEVVERFMSEATMRRRCSPPGAQDLRDLRRHMAVRRP